MSVQLFGWGSVPVIQDPPLGHWLWFVGAPQPLNKSPVKPVAFLAKRCSHFRCKATPGLLDLGARAVYTGLRSHFISTRSPVANALEDQSAATSKVKDIKFK